MKIILSREGVETRVSGFFFKAVVQVVLLSGSENWVVTPYMGRSLGGFQYQVAQPLMGSLLRQKPDRKWKYNSAAASREEAGFHTMEELICHWQNTVAQYITMPSLLDLCEGMKRYMGERVGMRWWEQAGINLSGAREASAAEAAAEKVRGE